MEYENNSLALCDFMQHIIIIILITTTTTTTTTIIIIVIVIAILDAIPLNPSSNMNSNFILSTKGSTLNDSMV